MSIDLQALGTSLASDGNAVQPVQAHEAQLWRQVFRQAQEDAARRGLPSLPTVAMPIIPAAPPPLPQAPSAPPPLPEPAPASPWPAVASHASVNGNQVSASVRDARLGPLEAQALRRGLTRQLSSAGLELAELRINGQPIVDKN
jgi:hypothetical protein